MTTVKHRWLPLIVTVLTVLTLACVLTACGSTASSDTDQSAESESVTESPVEETPNSGPITIALPADTPSTGRALLLLQDQGLIRLKDGTGFAATVNDVVENPNNIQFVESEAAALPAVLPDVDFGVFSGTAATKANVDLGTALVAEDPNSDAANVYANVVAVNGAEMNTPKINALVAALESQTVIDYVDHAYSGRVVTVFEPVDGSEIPEAEDDNVIKIGALPVPYADILIQVQPLLAEKGWELRIQEFSDASQLNGALVNGELDANYFQSVASLNEYNAANGTTLHNAAAVHFEPLGLYGSKRTTLEGLTVIN